MEEYEQDKITIEWDVAWQVFDEVNENNDITKHIDLNCLDINEAVNITKQQILQIAKDTKQYEPGFCCNGTETGVDHEVLSIKCAEDHLVEGSNEILTMIQLELKLDHYYSPESLTIMVKIDADTKYNRALNDM